MLTRQKNPFGKILEGSDCIFEWFETHPETAEQQRIVAPFGGRLTSPTSGLRRLAIPHARMDAFGGLYLLRHAAFEMPKMPSDSTEDVRHDSVYGDWKIYHHAFSGKGRTTGGQTITQKFLGAVIRSFSLTKNEEIDVVVAMDDLKSLSEENLAGNSLSIVRASSIRWSRLAFGPKDEWKAFAGKRGAWAIERVNEFAADPSPYLITSLGDLSRLPWCPPVDPRVFCMVPTPMGPNSANIVLWSSGDLHALSVCGDAGHKALAGFDTLVRNWRENLID